MREDKAGRVLTEEQGVRLDAQLTTWRDELVNLTKRNRLLYFKHTKSSSLEIVEPAAESVFRGLPRSWAFFRPPDREVEIDDLSGDEPVIAPAANEVVASKKTATELHAALRALERTASTADMETGLWVLYCAFGMLHWIDPADGSKYESPLLLLPARVERSVTLEGARLRAADGDPIINPALRIKLMTDFGIELPSLEEPDATPAEVIGSVREAVRGRPDWKVTERVVLSTFTFHKEAMYRDLLDNAEAVSGHDLVQLMALGAQVWNAEREYRPPPDEDLDSIAPPEDLVSVRDADATQRICILAARAGDSFVMNGPPGTGKSQTITNIITELIAAGRTVLFVSEKAAALDVVHKRLAEAKLDEFVLELHSHKATRKQVAEKLGRALDSRPHATTRFDEGKQAELARARERLNQYAIAVNERRVPLKQSVHQIIGRIAQLQELPHGPVAQFDAARLDPESLRSVKESAARLGRAWAPVSAGERFLWRHLLDADVSAGRQQQIEGLLAACAGAIGELTRALVGLDEQLGLGLNSTMDDASRLWELLAAVESHPGRTVVPHTWLSVVDLAALAARLDELASLAERHRSLTWDAGQIAGVNWRACPLGAGGEIERALDSLGREAPTVTQAPMLSVSGIDQALVRLRDVASAANDVVAHVSPLAAAFGLDASVVDEQFGSNVAELGALVGAATPPEPNWLNPMAQAALQEAESVLSHLVARYRQLRDSLRKVFSDKILDDDLVGLRARLRANGGVRKLTSTYRIDKKLLASYSVSGRVDDASVDRLDDAIVLQELRQQLRAAESQHAPLLGSYYVGANDTDLARVHRAIELARHALELAGGVPTPGIVSQLARGGQPDERVISSSQALKSAIDVWQQRGVGQLAALGVTTKGQDLRHAGAWVERMSAHLQHLRSLLAAVDVSLGREVTAGQAVNIARAVETVRDLESSVQASADQDRAVLGPGYRMLGTDFGQLKLDISWARSVAVTANRPLPPAIAERLVSVEPSAQRLAAATAGVARSWAALAGLFEAGWRDHLQREFMISLADGAALVDELRSSMGDIDEWRRFDEAKKELVTAGLSGVVEFVESERLAAEQVAPVIERSALEAWADATIANDPRLRAASADSQDSLVDRFRALDRLQVANASARVINVCSARRPTSAAGVAGTIRREALKKSRHMPIRTLLAQTSEVALALKPCFMMSPLTVSQFLPPSLVFDVVIFDEASQVRPSDSINCVYRGRQLIVAGDRQQLPPSGFFDAIAQDGTDEYDADTADVFESVLDVCQGSGLPVRSLGWHYRSQHEDLITYSNYRFYEGKLHTFPGALDRGKDVGVELVQVDGVYRRGGSRDNPIEAAKVVERVLAHRRDHPALTLGVVAFSSAQESAIVAEIERQSSTNPELLGLLDGDRLDGFFVKNLENVQGDERDIILFSVGYGRDENGKFTEQLGPLTKAGGERRLNVAITRARRRVEVISSVRGGDFPGTSSSPGVRHLQRYLEFAERGVSALALEMSPGGADAESPFEEEVIRAIGAMGFDAVPQVGVAGYRIDVGVRHPARPGEFVIAIECDGAAYHSSRVARDRDRLRQGVLEGLGWTLHRIWGPSWYHDRDGQARRLRGAIDDAVAGRAAKRTATVTAATEQPTVVELVAPLDESPAWARPYQLARYRQTRRLVGEFHEGENLPQITRAIEFIVQGEGPIHEVLLRQRISEAFGVKRTGSRVKDAVDAALKLALRQKLIKHGDSGFLVPMTGEGYIRIPTDDPASERAVGHVAPSERQEAIFRLVDDARRIEPAELLVVFARLFGWRRAGADIQVAFDDDLRGLLDTGRLKRDADGMVRRAETGRRH